MPGDGSLLDPWERTVSVTIEGRSLELPGNNCLLRLLQYLEVDLHACRLCWNGECENCLFTYVDARTAVEVTAKGCETEVVEGMRITRLPEGAVWPDG